MDRAMGQEVNDKQIGLSEELKKINGLTTVEWVRATTQIGRDSVAIMGCFHKKHECHQQKAFCFFSNSMDYVFIISFEHLKFNIFVVILWVMLCLVILKAIFEIILMFLI